MQHVDQGLQQQLDYTDKSHGFNIVVQSTLNLYFILWYHDMPVHW